MGIEIRPQSSKMLMIDIGKATLLLEERDNGVVVISDGERRFTPKLRK